MESKIITLKRDREASVLRMHPWIFSGAVAKADTGMQDGDVVEIQSFEGEFLGLAHCQMGSIVAKMISYEKVEVNQDFWIAKIQRAFEYRKHLGLTDDPNTNCYRLVHAEGDGCPGLIIDVYNKNLIIQCHSIGMHLSIEEIKNALLHVYNNDVDSVYDKSSETLPKDYAEGLKNSFLHGTTENTVVLENGHKFKIDWVHGQKTGFFIDQRENRKLLSRYCKGKSVLNTFCYTGGFSVYAGLAGATRVDSVDVSKTAIALTEENMKLNGLNDQACIAADTFDFLKGKENDYDVIILDPPAFAKNKNVKHNAVIGYKRINEMALRQIKPGGILFTFSCSQVVDKELFFNTIAAAAIEAKRNVRVIHYMNQPADHPILPTFLEGEYLKGLVLWVE